MRILFVSERFPTPLTDGGNLRTFHILRALASRHEVHLVTHSREGVDQRATDQISDLCSLSLVPRPNLLSSLLSTRTFTQPAFVAKNWSRPLLACVDRLLREGDFDAVHFNHLDTACYALHRNWPQRMVFDSHNCLSNMFGELARALRLSVKRAFYTREARQLARVERDACRRMDVVLACSDSEVDAFARLGAGSRAVLVPNGVDCSRFEPGPEAVEPGSIVFTGAMGYFPNSDASLYFCREVLPRLGDLNPRPKVYLVGKDPPPAMAALHDGQSIIVTGAVDDIRPYVARAMLVVVPLRHGAGTRLKILEAFAMGKAVVSTAKGAEGISAADGHEILLADNADELAGKIRRAWNDPRLRAALGANALRLVRQHYDWSRIQEIVLSTYDSLREKAVALR